MLVDPRRGEELFDRAMAKMKEPSDTNSRLYQQLVEVIDVLAVAPKDKLKYISRSSEFVSPDEEL